MSVLPSSIRGLMPTHTFVCVLGWIYQYKPLPQAGRAEAPVLCNAGTHSASLDAGLSVYLCVHVPTCV